MAQRYRPMTTTTPTGWASCDTAYQAGWRRDRSMVPAYPGPERGAYHAGWVDRQIVQAGKPKRYR